MQSTQQEDFWRLVLNYWGILQKRKWLIAGTAACAMLIGFVQASMQTPLFASSIRLQIDRSAPKIIEGGSVMPAEGADNEFMRTQFELLSSRNVAERVVVAANLIDDPDFLKPRSLSLFGFVQKSLGLGSSDPPPTMGPAAIRAATGIVMANRVVRPVSGARLVDITIMDPNPARAQRIADAYGAQFIASALDKRFEANQYAKNFLEDQVKALQTRLEKSEKAVVDFAEKEQMMIVTDRASITESNLAAANAALGNLISERIRNEQLANQARATTGTNLQQQLSNATIEGIRARKNALATEYQEKLQTFKPGYPGMVQITNKIQELDRQLEVEIEAIKKALAAAYEASQQQENEMKKQIEILRVQALDLQKRSLQYTVLKREAESDRAIYNSLLQRYKEVDVAGGIGANNIFVVDRPQLASGPSSPRLTQSLVMALLIGLGLGFATAYVLEQLDDTIRSPDEMERVTGLPTFGIIPRVPPTEFGAEFEDPRSGLAEANRSLCTALQFSTDRGLPKSILVTSSGPGEGKSTTSIMVAQQFANMGLKVLLIDSDLRKPSLSAKLGIDATHGLSTYLTGACKPPDAFYKTKTPNLAFMPAGPRPPNPAELLSSPRLLSLISLGQDVFDFIVLDGPPVLGLADAPLLANVASSSLFVVAAGQARTGGIRNAMKRLQLSRGSMIGTVLTKFDAKYAGYGYGYGYGYAYSYRYGGASQDQLPPPA